MTNAIVTIIVVTYNSARWLARMVKALEAQSEKRWRLVVIDNASNANERPAQTSLPAGSILIQSEINMGFAAANNRAAAQSDTPYLALLNPDAFPEPGWLAALISTASRFPEAAAIGSTQLRADHHGVFDGTGDVVHVCGIAYRSSFGRRRKSTPPLGETFAACAAAMLVRRDAFIGAGGFDESYFCFFEDVDLCFRLRLLGGIILQSPEAVVAHVGGGASSNSSGFAEFHGARNRLWTFIKCMPGPLLWPLLPAHLIATAIVASLAPLRGRGLDGWRGIIAGLSNLEPIWASRRHIQRTRKASVGDIAAALTWSPDVLITRRAVYRKVRA